MQQDLNRVIEQVSKEKGIDKSILINALENAMISAAKKTFGHQRKIEAQFNPEIGEVEPLRPRRWWKTCKIRLWR
jgi:N utilization substance protein A